MSNRVSDSIGYFGKLLLPKIATIIIMIMSTIIINY